MTPDDYGDLEPGKADSADCGLSPHGRGLNPGERASVVFVLNSRNFSMEFDPVTKQMRKIAGAWHGKARSGAVEIEVAPKGGAAK